VTPPYRPAAGTLTKLLACAVLPLILVGAGVTSKDAGMAFPDWPTSDGVLVNPPGWWQVDSKLWEHGHRLLGWTVGMLAIACVVACWNGVSAPRTLALTTLIAIVVQGVMGGLRVRFDSTLFAMLHGISGQACFCLACVSALFSSRGWSSAAEPFAARGVATLRRGCAIALAATFVQLVVGAAYRHFGHEYALAGHLIWAVVVIVMLGWLTMWILEQYPNRPLFPTLGKILAALLAAQLVLGGMALLVVMVGNEFSEFLKWAAPSAHVLVGAMLLACVLLITICAHRLLCPVVADEIHPSIGVGVAVR
jgi:cytochrome c oxidase assembly protein subunit 15